MAFFNIKRMLYGCSHYKQNKLITWIFSCVLLIYILQFINVHAPRDNNMTGRLKFSTRLLNRFIIETSFINKKINSKSPLVLEYAHTYKGRKMTYSMKIIDNRISEWIYHYNNFTFKEPLFINNQSRILFFNSKENKAALAQTTPALIDGRLYVVKNGTFDAFQIDCGYRATVKDVLEPRDVPSSRWYNRVLPITSPEAGTFQHFIDGALPKLIQALHMIKDHRLTVLFKIRPRDKIVLEILERLNITSDKIVYDMKMPIGADFLYFTCISPPLHPILWQSARRLIGAPEHLEVPLKEAYVVFVTRGGCHNCGRNVINKNDLVSLLTKRYGLAFKEFNGGYNLRDTIDLFGNARVILGSHGGGMYNINFAPINTTVIEFMPTLQDGTMMAASKKIIWNQAELLGQIYWRVAVTPINGSEGDMLVNLKDLEGILNITDTRQGLM